MIRRCIIFLLCILTVFSCFSFVYAAEEENPMISSGSHTIEGAKPYLGTDGLVENIKAAFLYETKSDTLLYQWHADDKLYPASLVKIMTALLVLENTDLQASVTVSQTALDNIPSDAISLKLQPGEQFTVETLMYALMVASANDAACVLAEHVSGSVTDFVSMMNSRAQELGCTGTTYMNPHGLHHENQVTTARDVCRILMAALEHEFFRTIFGTAQYSIPATNLSEERKLVTNNHLISTEKVGIYKDDRVIGGRAGVDNESFRNIASLSQSGDMEVICVVMGCASKIADNGYAVEVYGGFPETIALMNHAYYNQSRVQFLCKDQILKQQAVAGGASDVLYTAHQSFSAVLPSNIKMEQLSFRYEDVPGSGEAPIKAGQNLAALEVWYNDKCIAQTDVYAANDVAVAENIAGEYIKSASAGLVVVIVIVAFLLLATITVVVLLFLGKNRKPSKRRMKK